MPNKFNMAEYLKQYQNDDLCQKWHNNIPLKELQDEKYQYIDDSQDIRDCMEYFGDLVNHEIVTGIIAWIGDGEYNEFYVTESSRPYDLQSIYHPLSYYL